MMSAILAAVLLLQAVQPTTTQATASPRPPPSTADMPGWSKAPKPEDMTRAYPQEAARVSLAGAATLECTVGAAGELTDCVASDETPAGSGFGAASLSVASKFQMPTKAPSGASTAGRTVRFPLHRLGPLPAHALTLCRSPPHRQSFPHRCTSQSPHLYTILSLRAADAVF